MKIKIVWVLGVNLQLVINVFCSSGVALICIVIIQEFLCFTFVGMT